MAFKKTEEYYIYTIKNIKEAIDGTRRNMATLTDTRAIEAHGLQISSYQKCLSRKEKEFDGFMKRGTL